MISNLSGKVHNIFGPGHSPDVAKKIGEKSR
jgi:hypothetical protein